MTYQERFEELILRMQSDRKRYDSINTLTKSPDEERIAEICWKFHRADSNINGVVNVKDDMDPKYANRLLDELEGILHKLEWGE